MKDAVVTMGKFRMTELGLLPSEWEVVKLGDVVSFSSKPRNLELNAHDRIPFVPMEYIPNERIDINRYERKAPAEIGSGTFFFKGDLLVAKITPSFENGKQCIVDNLPIDFGYATTEVWPLHETDKADLLYLFYYLKRKDVRADIAGKMEGSTGRQRVPRSVLETLRIALPPLPEQKHIAAVLSAVQEAKEKTAAVIQATRQLKKSLMKHLFTYGPVPLEEAGNVPLKETEIGLVPEGWEVVKLGAVCQKTRQADPTRNPEVKFSYIDVSSISRDFLSIVDSTEYVGANAPSRARKVIRRNDVIFATVRPYLKRIAVVPAECDGQICSTAFCVIKANPAVAYSDYFFYAVSRDAFVERVSEHQRGSSYPAVTDKDVLRELIPLPPMPIQQRIASTLVGADKKIETEETKKKALEELFRTLLGNLMTGRIRVNHVEVEA